MIRKGTKVIVTLYDLDGSTSYREGVALGPIHRCIDRDFYQVEIRSQEGNPYHFKISADDVVRA